MINILLPMAGKSLYFSENEYHFPKPLIEIGNKTMIERVVNNLSLVGTEVQFTFVLSGVDCRRYHLDSTLNIITDNGSRIVRLDGETKGAACSALMAIGTIGDDLPLIIANSDQLFDDSPQGFLRCFQDADAGVVTFESVHPRWSYVRTDEHGFVIEAAEKRPISRDAIAGFYYFRRGYDFVQAAMRSIKKNSTFNENYYIAPTLNELILQGKTIRVAKVDSGRYHTFYTPQKIGEYERKLIGDPVKFF